MRLRRGFKSEANQLSRDVRRELKLRPIDPLNPFELATFLEIPVVPLRQLSNIAAKPVEILTTTRARFFSAATIFDGSRRTIVHNDSHDVGRQSSNLAHEISHSLLHHPPAPALGADGSRLWNGEIELEADWLAGALLVSEEAALSIARQRLSDVEAAKRYSVSVPMVRFRLNVTNARGRVARVWRGHK